MINKTIIIVLDCNSKFPAVENLKIFQSLTVFNTCKKINLRDGIRKEIIADSRPEFTSYHFHKF